jgi:hypothetical protein
MQPDHVSGGVVEQKVQEFKMNNSMEPAGKIVEKFRKFPVRGDRLRNLEQSAVLARRPLSGAPWAVGMLKTAGFASEGRGSNSAGPAPGRLPPTPLGRFGLAWVAAHIFQISIWPATGRARSS